MQLRTSFGFLKKKIERVILIFVLPVTIASRKIVNSGGFPPNAASKKTPTFGLYSTSKQSHMKVRSKYQRLGVGLIKMLINLHLALS